MKHVFIFLLAFLSFFSCKNDVELFSDDSSNKISIEITGDENIIIKTENIEIKKGSKWKSIKRKTLKCIQYEKGYVFASSFLDDEQLTEDYVFNEDSTIYITSKLRKESLAKKIIITLKGDKYIEIEDDEIETNINSSWQEIKDEVTSRLQFYEGYELLGWKLGRAKNAKVLSDNYIFKRNSTIYALSKEAKGIEENRIILNLIGDENVELQHTVIGVPLGLTWLEIKNTEYISSAKAKEGYTLSDWKIENNLNGKSINDDYVFNLDITLYIFAIKKDFNKPSVPDAPIDVPTTNTEIDALGMVQVLPPTEGIRGEKIDYPLCNYFKEDNEKLWHGVFVEGSHIKLKPYKIHQYETTYKLWKEVYEWSILHGYAFENIGRKGCGGEGEKTEDDEPVTEINYRDCLVWCNAYTEKLTNSTSSCVYLEKKEGKVLKNAKEEKDGKNLCDCAYIDLAKTGIRLPTEAEWEFAARLQTKTKTNAVLCSGVYLTCLNSASGAYLPICTPKLISPSVESMYRELLSTVVCKRFCNGTRLESFSPKVTKTKKVGSKRANQLGLYDMSGNVGEWCSDITTDEMFLDCSGNSFAIVRGGGWSAPSYKCSVGYRDARYTQFAVGTIGFRFCQTK